MIYLVDYENVNLSGLAGIEKLGEEDKVVVFVGNNMGSIPFEWHIRISDARAEVKYIKCGKVSKNYLDFQLATFCGYLMAGLENEKVYVVSKDKGYDSVVDFWTENKPDVGLKRVESIDESLGILINKEKNQSQRQRRSGTRSRGRRNNNSRQGYGAEASVEEIKVEATEVAEVPVETLAEEVKVEAAEVVEAPVETPAEEVKVEAAEVVEAPVEIPAEEITVETAETVEAAEEVETSVEEIKVEAVVAAEEVLEEAKPVESESVTEVIEEPKQTEAEQIAEALDESKQAEPETVIEKSEEPKQTEKGKEQKEKKKQKKQKEQKEEKEKKASEPVMNKLSESTKKHIRQKIKDEQLKGGSYKTIYNIFMTEKAKNRFNTALVKAFQQERGNRIYKKLVSEFEEHLKSQKEE